MSIKVGDSVVFKGSVIKRCNHSEYSKNFKGEVVAVFGGTCDVKTLDGVKAVPVANLAKVKEVYDYRTEKSSKIILDIQ